MTKTIKKSVSKKTRLLQTKKGINKWLGVTLAAFIIGLGIYLLAFSKAAPNNCSSVEGGAICDVNQVSSPDGTDALVSIGDEALNLAHSGWRDWGVGFRAPNKAINGAKPVHRFWYPSVNMHGLAIEGSADYTNYLNLVGQGKAYDEGIYFYAYTASSRPSDTVPIYTITRKPWYFLALYTADWGAVDYFVSHTDGTYEYAGNPSGINFYAYPADYVPPAPKTSTQTTKDTNCSQAGLRVGDKGACVQWLKGVMNTKFGTKFDTTNNSFDSNLNSNIVFFVKGLQNAGVKVDTYSNVVTQSIWNALGAGFPASSTTPVIVKSNANNNGITTITPTTSTPTSGNTAVDCSKLENFVTDACVGARQKLATASSGSSGGTTSNRSSGASGIKVSPDTPPAKEGCPQLSLQETLTQGETLEENCVKFVQATLVNYGYPVAIDGKWGPQTQNALKGLYNSIQSSGDGKDGTAMDAECIRVARTLIELHKKEVEVSKASQFAFEYARDNFTNPPLYIGGSLADKLRGNIHEYYTRYDRTFQMSTKMVHQKRCADAQYYLNFTYTNLLGYSNNISDYIKVIQSLAKQRGAK